MRNVINEKVPSVRFMVTHPDGHQEIRRLPLLPDSEIDDLPLEEFLGIQHGGSFELLPAQEGR